jgi:hypothetical protein
MKQREAGTFAVSQYPFVPLGSPHILNLRRGPDERSTITSNSYYDGMIDRAYMLVPAQAYVGPFLQTFQEIPPRHEVASFNLEQVMQKLEAGAVGVRRCRRHDHPDNPHGGRPRSGRVRRVRRRHRRARSRVTWRPDGRWPAKSPCRPRMIAAPTLGGGRLR